MTSVNIAWSEILEALSMVIDGGLLNSHKRRRSGKSVCKIKDENKEIEEGI